MNTEAQRIAIAEACGWKISAKTNRSPSDSRYSAVNDRFFGLPDYLNDLNAMHEAEKTFDDCEIRWGAYKSQLFVLLEPHRHYLHATAAQRAEAFLKTLNLWKDTP
jgi:hypothetical protein